MRPERRRILIANPSGPVTTLPSPAMAKKRKIGSHREARKPAAPKPAFTSPFRDLKKMLAAHALAAPKTPPKQPVTDGRTANAIATEVVVDDEAALREALAGVRPLAGRESARRPLEPPVNHTIVSEDAEVIAQLSDLVSGQAPFDITETEEYVEGARVGIDPRLVGRLRRGEFAVQSHIDLHGMIQGDAHAALRTFVLESVRKGHRTVLVVHGRGLRSPGGRPVLKHAAAGWLSHGEVGAHVLAFATARAQDGGAGAMYVLLRRERRRGRFDILQGAKRRE
jgi:DNA-nicking Smr family endonuclease